MNTIERWRDWLKQAAIGWYRDKADRLSASLAYYTLLSLAPILMLTLAIASVLWGDEAARGKLARLAARALGSEVGAAIQGIVQQASSPKERSLASVASLVVLAFGASGVFSELQSSMNTIWGVEPRHGYGVRGFLFERAATLAMVLVATLFLLLALLLHGWIFAQQSRFGGPHWASELLWSLLALAVSLALMTLTFALVFKSVPNIRIRLRDVWSGAVLTSGLYCLGEFVVAVYLEHSTMGTPYGAGGSVIALVTWIYYSAQILLFGAEFTKVRAADRGT